MKIRTAITAFVLSTVLVSLPIAAGQQSIYEKALVLEETQLKLQEAIALYQQVVDGSKDKALAAQAQLRIGLCYEKLGAAEAEMAFLKVIENYTDQPAAVQVARERLLALTDSAAAATARPGGLVMRELSVPKGQPSPDGKYIAFVNSGAIWSNLALYEVATGSRIPLTNLGAEKSKTSDFWMVNEPVSWSADGSQIAFWTLIAASDGSSKVQLCTIDRDGSNMKVILATLVRRPFIAGWTADNSALVAVIQNLEGSNSIQRISLSDGNVTEVKMIGKGTIRQACLSPDSLYIAYDLSSGVGPALKSDIHVVSIDGSFDVPVIDHSANDRLMGWNADSSHIIFSSNRNGETAIWAQAIKEGRSTGNPQYVRSIAGNAIGLGITRNGSFYYSEGQIGGNDVYIAQIDLKTGETLITPERVEPAFARHSSTPFWSPQGNYLGYLVRTSNNAPSYNTLRLYSPSNGTKRDIALTFSAYSLQQPPRWDAAGNYIYLTGNTGVQRQMGLYQIEVSTGRSRLIHQSDSRQMYIRAWSADGEIVYLRKSDSTVKFLERIESIILKDLKSGEEREVLRSSKPGESIECTGLSPDGKWLGLSMSQSDSRWFCVMPASGGTVRRLVQQNPITGIFGMFFFWSPLSDGALFERKTSTEGMYSLSYMPSFESKEMIEFDLEMPRINGLTFHPDGKTIAFNTISPSETKVWVMENFLPAKK